VNGSLRVGNNGYDSTPGDTAFSHTIAANSNTSRVVNFDGNGFNPSVWWTNGNTRLAAIDGENEGLAFWTNNTAGSWNKNFYINPGNAIFTGNVGIGVTSPSYKLDVSGTIRATGDVIAYSDARVKDNVVTIENALDKVTKLRGVSYTRNDVEDETTKIGVIAQEVLEVLPEVVQQDDEGKYSVAYGNMVGLLIESIKELKAEVDELKSKPCNCNCKK
jgi:hypothetical protein